MRSGRKNSDRNSRHSPQLADLYEIQGNVLVEGVEDQQGHPLVAPCPMHEQ